MEMHEKLKLLRKERGFTQSQVAEKIGQERSTVACYENGSRKPAVDVLEKLAHLYGVTLDYFSNQSSGDIMIELLARSNAFFSSQNISEADRDKVFQDVMKMYLAGKELNSQNARKDIKASTDRTANKN